MWLHGLLAAFISGCAMGVSMLVVDPEHMQKGEWSKIDEMALVGGVIGAAAYLKQSPLPNGEDKDESK